MLRCAQHDSSALRRWALARYVEGDLDARSDRQLAGGDAFGGAATKAALEQARRPGEWHLHDGAYRAQREACSLSNRLGLGSRVGDGGENRLTAQGGVVPDAVAET